MCPTVEGQTGPSMTRKGCWGGFLSPAGSGLPLNLSSGRQSSMERDEKDGPVDLGIVPTIKSFFDFYFSLRREACTTCE